MLGILKTARTEYAKGMTIRVCVFNASRNSHRGGPVKKCKAMVVCREVEKARSSELEGESKLMRCFMSIHNLPNMHKFNAQLGHMPELAGNSPNLNGPFHFNSPRHQLKVSLQRRRPEGMYVCFLMNVASIADNKQVTHKPHKPLSRKQSE